MAKEYLDKAGLTYFFGKLKDFFQVKLVSGTNIKTINNTSLLGSGNISISATSGVSGVKGDSESSYRTGDVNITAANVGAVPTTRKVNNKALSSDITLSASDVSALATSAAYTRSSAGTLDWSNTTEGNAKVIMKSALAFWNGAYSGTSSTLTYCSKGEIIGTNNINNYANQLAKAETIYTGSITFDSAITTQTTNVLKRKGNLVQCEIRFSAPSTRVSNQAIGTIPTGYRPLQRMYVNGVRAWAVQATAPILINTDGAIKFMNEAFASSASYVIAVTWITDDNYPS